MTIWDKIYKNYQKGGPAYASLGFEIYPLFKKFINQSNFQLKSALDIGCGDGRYLKYLEEMGFKTDGIDSSATSVKMTRKLLKNKSRIVFADMFKYKILPDKYDFIISINTIQHGRKVEIKKLINRIYLALRENGQVFITFPDHRQVKKWRSFKKNKKIVAGTYIPLSGPEKGLPHSFFTKIEIEKMFLKFKNVKMEMDRGRWLIQGKKP